MERLALLEALETLVHRAQRVLQEALDKKDPLEHQVLLAQLEALDLLGRVVLRDLLGQLVHQVFQV